jgi:hypothetical protein
MSKISMTELLKMKKRGRKKLEVRREKCGVAVSACGG